MNLFRRAATVGGLTLVSRVFGFMRDVVMAAVLGAGPVADAFMVAFRLPNHFRAIFAEGAFNAAFIPTYSALRQREGDDAARSFRSMILAWSLAANGILLFIALASTGGLVALLAPGLAGDPQQYELAVTLTRTTFPYLACIAVVTLLSGVLNAHDRFAAAAAAPILLNIAMTVALLLAASFPTAAHAAAWGVLSGGFLQLALVAFAGWRAGLGYAFVLPKLNPEVAVFFRRFGPAVLGAGGIQIAMFADTIIASFLPAGSLSYLYYADRLYQLPLAVVGIAIGTALLPDLSRRASTVGDGSAPSTLGHAVAICLIFGVPSAVGLALLGDLVVEVLFARGAFTPEAVAGAASALAAYAVGLPAAVALRALVAGFHARGDTMTPVKALGAASVVNIALKLMLVGSLLHVGLALATAAGALIYAGLLAFLLLRAGSLSIPREDRNRLFATGTGALLSVIVLAAVRPLVELRMAALFPRWEVEASLAVLAMLSLVLFAAPYAMAEVANRRYRRR